MAGRSVPIRVVFTGNTADLEAAFEKAAAASDEANNKMVYSARSAAAAAIEQAKQTGASADDITDAAARAATAYEEASKKISSSAVAAGAALADQAKAAGRSVTEQSAAYDRGVAAVIRMEDAQKAAADAAKVAGVEQARAAKLAADAQADQAAKMDLLQSKMSGLGEHATGLAKEISKLGGIGFGASIAGMGDLAAKFQQSTEQIAANSDISSAAAMKIGKALLTTSGQSIYSAKELADAYAQVSGQLKATEGQALNSSQALKVMNAAGDLAEATSDTLGDATSSLATVMQAYRMSVGQSSQASDTLFNVSRALNVPLDAVAQSVNRLHGRMGDLAPSLGEIGGLMVELGSHGIQGSRGINVANTAMQTLVGGSTQVDQVLNALGVNIFNAQGKFVGMTNVIRQLQPVFAQLSQQQQDLAAKTLFGSSAAQVMLGIVEQGPDAYAKSIDAAQKMGTAHKAAADQSKTLGKQLDILKASVEDAATSIGLKLLPYLTDMTKDLESGVQWLEQHKQATEALAVAIGTVLAGAVTVFAYEKAAAFVTGVADMTKGVTNLVTKLPFLGSAQKEAQTETQALTAAVQELSGALSAATPDATGAGTAIEGLGTAAGGAAPELSLIGTDAEMAAGKFEALGSAAAAATPEIETLDGALGSSGLLGTVTALGGKLGVLSAAFGAFEALKQTPGIGNVLGNGSGPKNSFATPTPGETEREYISKTLGLPAGYKGPLTAAGIIHARTQQGYPAEKSLIEQFFKQISEQGHFGHHGFVPKHAASVPGMSNGKVDYKAANFPRPENQFIQSLASLTKLSPAVIAGWADAEEPPGGAANAANPYNFLNIGESGTTYRGTPTKIWSNPTTAAEATYQWIKSGKGVPGWGAGGVPSILASGGGSISSQIAAIQNSGWVNGVPNDPSANYPNLAADVQAVLGSGKALTGSSAIGQTVTPKGGSSGSPVGTNSKINLSNLLAATSPAVKSGQTLLATLQSALETGSLSTLRNLTTPAEQQKISQQEGALRGSGDAGLANQIAATMKQIFQTLAQSMLANQITYQAQALSNQGQELQDRTQLAQDHGQDQLNVMKALQQRVDDMATDHVTRIKNVQQRTDDVAAAEVTSLKNRQQLADDTAANVVTHIQDMTQTVSDQMAAAVTALKDAATVGTDQSKGIVDAITDNAQITADTLGEKGLYGLNLVAQQLTVQSDVIKAGFDQQLDTAQKNIDVAQQQADLQESSAQVALDQVTAVQHTNVALAQQHMDLVTQRQDALVAKAQAHMDAVTTVQDSKVARAQAHMDQVTAIQDQRITRAQAHADAVTLHMDTSKVGPAQTALDMNANASQSVQSLFQAQLSKAQGSASQQEGTAQLSLANVTNSANSLIQTATNAYDNATNAANKAIQQATDAYDNTSNSANKAIQVATDAYNTANDKANIAIQNSTTYLTKLTSNWNLTIQNLENTLTGIQNQANIGEAAAAGRVSTTQAEASTEFAGSGLVVNMYGMNFENAGNVASEMSWAVRSSGLQVA